VVVASYIPGDVIAAANGALAAAVLALAVALTRTRERLVKLEEWARLNEKYGLTESPADGEEDDAPSIGVFIERELGHVDDAVEFDEQGRGDL
jgi:hypothetical protein